MFGGLSPIGGYGGSGADLYVKSTDINTHAVDSYGPNISANSPIDQSNKVWEYQAKVFYDASPLLNMSALPFVGEVPGLGKPVRIQFSAHKLVEHPDGLTEDADIITFGKQPNGSIMNSFPSGTGGGGVLPDGTSWFVPDIYDRIDSANQSIVSQNVLIVDSRNADWTLTGLVIQPGQNAWIDSRADGLWSFKPDTHRMVDADGYSKYGYGLNGPWQLGAGMLIARVNNGGEPFEVGKYKLNKVPPGYGELQFIMNDFNPKGTSLHDDNIGVQYVRVIITQ